MSQNTWKYKQEVLRVFIDNVSKMKVLANNKDMAYRMIKEWSEGKSLTPTLLSNIQPCRN